MTDLMNPTPILPVILSGGAGRRLWPLSTDQDPKQFHALVGDETLLQQAARRLSALKGGLPPAVICSREHVDRVREQFAAIGLELSAVVAEPEGRNTAAAALVAGALTERFHPGARTLLAPADHWIPDSAPLVQAVARASAAPERIVVFGVTATTPETGYGYIRPGEALTAEVSDVEGFAEKPDRTRAESHVAAGHLWNAGIFLFGSEVLRGEFQRYRPDILAGVDKAMVWRSRQLELDSRAWAEVPSESLDVAVMERTERAAVVRLDGRWRDLGIWDRVVEETERDRTGNALSGPAAVVDCRDVVVRTSGLPAVVVGLEGVIVVVTSAGVLVSRKGATESVKDGVARLARGGSEAPI